LKRFLRERLRFLEFRLFVIRSADADRDECFTLQNVKHAAIENYKKRLPEKLNYMAIVFESWRDISEGIRAFSFA